MGNAINQSKGFEVIERAANDVGLHSEDVADVALRNTVVFHHNH